MAGETLPATYNPRGLPYDVGAHAYAEVRLDNKAQDLFEKYYGELNPLQKLSVDEALAKDNQSRWN